MSWVIDEAPVPTALFPVLMVIARRCDAHGRGSYQSAQTIATKTGKSVDQVKRDIRDLKKLGLLVPGDESLVAHIDIWSRPSVYDVPLHVSGPKPVKESKNKAGVKGQGGGMDAPPGMDATGWHGCTQGGGMDAPGGGGMDAPLTKPLNNPLNKPSLSPRENEAPARTVDAIEPEREADEASPKPETIKTNPVHVLLVDAGCPEDLTEDMERELRRRNNVRAPGPAWFRTVAANGELADHVSDALEAFQPAHPVEQLPDAHEFEPKTDGSPDCQRCPFPELNRRHKLGNQTPARWVTRAGVSAPNHKRSTGVMRAEQALRVAAQLDEFERNGGGFRPGSNYHQLVDSHSPNRDYSGPL